MRMFLLLLGFLFVSVVALPLLSVTVARLVIDDGIEGFRGDPIAYKVASKAYAMAEAYRDNPMQRLTAPAGRVVAVTFKPGHCLQPSATAAQPLSSSPTGYPSLAKVPDQPDAAVLREYTARVRFYTFFGYPVEDVYVECGGDSASTQR